MTARRLTAVALWFSAFLAACGTPSSADANPWHRAHYYGATNRSPDDVWADLCDGYDSCWAQPEYRHWFGYDGFVYLQGCWGQCGYTPLHYRGFAPGALTGSPEYTGASWYRLPRSAERPIGP